MHGWGAPQVLEGQLGQGAPDTVTAAVTTDLDRPAGADHSIAQISQTKGVEEN